MGYCNHVTYNLKYNLINFNDIFKFPLTILLYNYTNKQGIKMINVGRFRIDSNDNKKYLKELILLLTNMLKHMKTLDINIQLNLYTMI